MASPKSFGDIYKELVNRKRWEEASKQRFEERKCRSCSCNIVKNGVSQIPGVCKNCVDASLQQNE